MDRDGSRLNHFSRYNRDVAVHLFFNPELVGQLAACGITGSRRSAASAPTSGFVLDGRRSPLIARQAVTNVIAVQGAVTITGQRQLSTSQPTPSLLAVPPAPQTALELVEECGRLRRDNQRLVNEVDRLRSEVARLIGGPRQPAPDSQSSDDTALRFALLELD